jgi:class 3 adenylate cyclase/predicted ATPase
MASIADFLKSIGMEEYAAGLSDSGVNMAMLSRMTDGELERLGFGPEDRRRLQAASQAHLAGASSSSPAPERRHITILFCDLVGSTTISTRVDPETLLDIIGAYRQACVNAIGAARGFVAKFVGDGLLAYFGYPRAGEDDAERAVVAALDLIASVGRLKDDLGQPLQTRVGIASGLVLIGDLIAAGAAHDHDVVGETPNLAARLQTRAEPNTVLIGAETRRLLGDLFEYVAVGETVLKGFAAPVAVWRVVGAKDSPDRFRALRNADTPIIGRKAEAEAMINMWERAKAGSGGAILISGEPGIGKSRLAQTIVAEAARDSRLRLQFFCTPNRQSSALLPFVNQLRAAAEIKRGEPPAESLDKLESLLRRAAMTADDAAPLLAELLSIPAMDRLPRLELTPQRRRARTLQILLALVEAAAREPVLAVFEDIHWIDPTSLDLLTLIVERARELRLLIIMTCRPEFSPPWQRLDHVTELPLGRLSREQSAEIIAGLAAQASLPSSMVDEIIDRTDGVPLFLEELTKVVAERGTLARSSDIPVTLRDMLTARLDLLGQAKQVARVAAVFGTEFSAQLLGDVMRLDEAQLRAELAKLVEAEIVFEPSQKGSNTYRFKHALLQEAAYQMLSRQPRQEFHMRAAEAIRALQPDIAQAQPEILAQHYAQADRTAEAIEHWRAAADKAIQRSSNVEATNHLSRALASLKLLPETPERLQLELALLLAQGTPLIATKGFASADVEKVYARAREICALAGNPPQLFPVLWGLWVFYTARADHATAHGLAAECRQIADGVGDADLLLLARHAKGVTLSAMGEHAAALDELEAVVSLYDKERHARLAFVYGQDSGVVCRSQAAFCLWHLGFPDRAFQRNAEALELARTLSHPYSLAAALVFSAWIHQMADDRPGARRDAEAAIEISVAHDFAFWLLTGMILRGWALTIGDTCEQGLALLQQGLAGYQAAGAGIMRPYYLALTAQALAQNGSTSEARAQLDKAAAAALSTGESWFEPQLYWLEGEIILADTASRGDEEAIKSAKNAFEKGLETAVRQGALTLELLAAVSLAELEAQLGADSGARNRVAKLYREIADSRALPVFARARALLSL